MGTDCCGGAGHHRIAIGGHSGGAVRATYAQATERFDNVAAVIAVSPGEYDREGVIALNGESFSGPFREPERNIAEGHPDVLLSPGIPWGSTWSARAYVDCFNRDNRYSVTTHATNTGCPTLYIFGAKGSAVGGPQELPVVSAAQRSRMSWSIIRGNEKFYGTGTFGPSKVVEWWRNQWARLPNLAQIVIDVRISELESRMNSWVRKWAVVDLNH